MAYTHHYSSKNSKGHGVKQIIEAKFKVAYGASRPDTDEFGTEMLDDSMIMAAIKEVNEKCMPMILTIDFEDGYNSKFTSIQIPILPACVEYHKKEDMFARRYACAGNPEKVYDLTQEDSKAGRYDINKLTKWQAAYIKNYIRLKLIAYYAKLSHTDDNQKIHDIIESYDIVRKYYDVSKLKTAQIDAVNLYMIKQELGNNNLEIVEAVYEYSKKYQTENKDNDNVCFVYGNGTHLIGLKKGRTPEEIEKIAKLDAISAQKQFEMETVDMPIISEYNTSHALGDYELIPKQQPTQHVGESQSTQNQTTQHVDESQTTQNQPTQSKPSQFGEE